MSCDSPRVCSLKRSVNQDLLRYNGDKRGTKELNFDFTSLGLKDDGCLEFPMQVVGEGLCNNVDLEGLMIESTLKRVMFSFFFFLSSLEFLFNIQVLMLALQG